MNDKFRKLEINLLLVFSMIFVVSTVAATTFLTIRSNQTLRKYVSGMVTANGRQIELNIDNYLQEIEKAVSLLFADKDNLTYEKSNTNMAEYRRIQVENSIQEQVLNVSLMENFSDFAILYSDGGQIGWISNNTSAMYSEGDIYKEYAAKLENAKKQESWSFEYQENFSRVYYAKRLNQSAIILASFYGSELASAFEVPRELKDMTIRLTDENLQIVYSTTMEEIGGHLPQAVTDLLGGENMSIQTGMNDELLATENVCQNQWRVYGTIPTESLLRENRTLYRRTMAGVVILLLTAVILTIGFYKRYSYRLNHMVGEISDRANSDLMTGLLNKAVFTQKVTEDLEAYTGKQAVAFLMFDIDNFKQINDQLGHVVGDAVISCMADALRSSFSREVLMGRIGGDEFGVYASFTRKNRGEAEAELRSAVEHFYEIFREKAKETGKGEFISASSGIAVAGPGEYTYEQLYRTADRLLYLSKAHGKDTATFESEVSEEVLRHGTLYSEASERKREGEKR